MMHNYSILYNAIVLDMHTKNVSKDRYNTYIEPI